MKRTWKTWIERNRKIAAGILVFVAILVVAGILMHDKMKELLNYYVEQQAVRQGELLAGMTEDQFEEQLRQLQRVADYMQYHEEARQDIIDTFVTQNEHVLAGLLETDGNAVYGEALDFLAFSGIRQSFRGESAVSYSSERGLLFTVPVYRDKNVRYVLYKLYDVNLLYDQFGISCYEGEGRVLIMDRQEQIIIPSGDSVSAGNDFLQTEEIYDAFSKMREELQVLPAASEYVQTSEGSYFLFSSEMADIDMFLVGMVPENVAMKGISYLIVLVLWVFSLLMIVFLMGVVYLFGAEKKVKESDELREAKLMADNANRAKSDFLTNMSHEIRTPINAIMGMNEMILRECEQEEISEYAQNIQSASQTLLSLINDILDFSKIESGKMEIIDSTYDLISLLNDVVNMVRIKAEEKNLWLYVNIDESLPSELWGDDKRNRQVMVNILNNAVKYTKEGGISLSVIGEPVDGDRIMLKIQVADTGIGIREEDLSKLFHNFERLDLNENRNVEGTGLGLAITHRLVTQMNGQIEVESEYGIGSTFTISLPQGIMNDSPIGDFQGKYQSEMKKKPYRYRESFVAPDAKVLVVDDTSMNLLVISKLLKKTHIQVATCLSGKECLYMIQKEHYDVILLDHMMPGMDGVETLRTFKNMYNHKCQDTPVIALTANAIVGVHEMYMREGFDDYLSKPVEGSQLEEMIKKYIPAEKIQIVTEEVKTSWTEEKAAGEHTFQNYMADRGKSELTWLDVDMGLRYCADSEEVYREVLQEFCDVAGEERADIEKAYADEDWKDYTIRIHGLKSSALSVGAKKLSEEAASLERVGNELQKEDTAHREELVEYIKEYHGRTMKLYEDSAEEGKQWIKLAN